MAVKLSSIKADLARELKGDWVDYPTWPGVSFNVSSLFISAYRIDFELLTQRLGRQNKGKPIPPDTLMSEIGKIYAKHILHDWRGFDVEYSAAKASDLLADPEYRELVNAVEWCARKLAELDVEFVQDEVKNSARPSKIA